MKELEAAPPEVLDQLRRLLAVAPAAPVAVERRRGPRKTYAWYILEELGEAVKRRAEEQAVPPSEVVERILLRAKEAGWL